MYQYLRRRFEPWLAVPEQLPDERVLADPLMPASLQHINSLPEPLKKRLYRLLVPPALLTRLNIDPVTWHGIHTVRKLVLHAPAGGQQVRLTVETPAAAGLLFYLELQDNSVSGLELNLLVIQDPVAPCFPLAWPGPVVSPTAMPLARNRAAEEQALLAGLAPAQCASGLRMAGLVLQQIETFVTMLGQAAYSVRPLTYHAAWLFERHGFAYMRGHSLMNTIQREFQPGGRLQQALDGSSPFRQAQQADSVRGRAWAIYDGILATLGKEWAEVQMIKLCGRHAQVNTLPGVIY